MVWVEPPGLASVDPSLLGEASVSVPRARLLLCVVSQQFGVGLLLDAARLIEGVARVGDDVELVEGDLGVRQVLGDPFDEGGRPFGKLRTRPFGKLRTRPFGKLRTGMSIDTDSMASGSPRWARKSSASRSMVAASLP